MVPTKILAIGAGGLQRALTHEFVHILNQRNLYNGGIFVGQPRGAEKADAFNQQGGVYHVVTFDLKWHPRHPTGFKRCWRDDTCYRSRTRAVLRTD